MKLMKFNCNSPRVIRAIVGVGAALVSGLVMAATPPPQFTYQGRLMEIVNGLNIPVKNGTEDIFTVTMWVRLYDSVSAEKPSGALYGRKITTILNKGMFTIDIGDEYGEALPAVYTNLLTLISNCTGATLLVGVTPFDDANDEVMPRQQLFSAPYALLANDVTQALGDFTATNGTSLFQSLEVTGQTVFKGPVTNQSTVVINGNVTFANGLNAQGALQTKQLSVGGTLTQSAGTATVNGNLDVTGNATFQPGPLTISGGATPKGPVTAKSLTVQGTLDAGAVTAATSDPINLPTFTSPLTLTVTGKAVFGKYFKDSTWPSRSSASSSEGSFEAPYDGLYMVSVIIRRDNRGKGSLTFTLNGKTIKPEMISNSNQYTATETTLTVLMMAKEKLTWGTELSENTDYKSQVQYRAFNSL
jgi:hypothetical protein